MYQPDYLYNITYATQDGVVHEVVGDESMRLEIIYDMSKKKNLSEYKWMFASRHFEKEKEKDRELFESICEKYGVKKDNEGNGLRIVTEDGQVKPLTKELLHEIFPFDVPFVTGLSADSADVPECETWSNNEEPIEIKYGEKNLVDFTKLEYNKEYPFVDDDGRHYRVSYVHTKVYQDEEKSVYFSSNTNGLTRDCASCKHYKDYKDVNTGRVIRGCESWECNYEMRG